MIEDWLNQDVEILEYNDGESGWGNEEGGWTIYSTLKGRVRLLSGREQLQDATRKMLTTHRAYLISPPDHTHRVQCEGKVYRVVLVDQPVEAYWYEVDLELLPEESMVSEEE